jgi:NAD(P)-dependent dehydrogenase (short-subunit alcohol dehydrogenase family)
MTDAKKEVLSPEAIIPILASDNITQADLLTASKVLSAISKFHPKHKITIDGDDKQYKKRSRDESLKLYQDSSLRPIRKAIAGVFELHKLQLHGGSSEEDYYANRIEERTLKRQKMAEKLQQKKYIADTELRRGRIAKLDKLKLDSKEEEEARLKIQALMVPDGHVDTEMNVKMIQDGNVEEKEQKDGEGIKLPKLRSCYVCKVRFRDLHPFYDQLCAPCAKLNFEKRHFKVDLSGKVAVVTGSRVKIGYQVCLKLLRAGCKVVATTRFPNIGAENYKKEKDFGEWCDNLSIFGLDLRDVVGLEAFTRFVKIKFGDQGVDILINNACQTVRRPTGYYKPMVAKETNLWQDADQSHKKLLRGCMEFETLRRKLLTEQKQENVGFAASLEYKEDAPMIEANSDDQNTNGEEEKELDKVETAMTSKKKTVTAPFETTGLSYSTAMSQMTILPDDVGVSSSILPPGMSDINGHQIDLRTSNSWLLKMDQVSTPEIMECMYINAIAPFVLNSRLQPLMTSPAGDDRPDRYIINVSAMVSRNC